MSTVNEEVEVFRIYSKDFGDKEYYFALYTRKDSTNTNVKYYTTNTLKYVGKYKKKITHGFGDGSKTTLYFETFDGEEIIVELDYNGKSCFRQVN